MSTLQIHLMMAAMGVLVCLAFVGFVSYRHHPSFKRTLLGLFAGGLVAVSPFIASLFGTTSDAGILPKSLILAVTGVLGCILYYLLSRWPVKHHAVNQNLNSDPSRHPVRLSADDPSLSSERNQESIEHSAEEVPTLLRDDTDHSDFPTLEIEEDSSDHPIYDVSEQDMFEDLQSMSTNTDVIDDEDNVFVENMISEVDGSESTNKDSLASDEYVNDGNVNAVSEKHTTNHAAQEIEDNDPLIPIAANDDAIAGSSSYDDPDDLDIDNSVIFDLTGQHEIPSDLAISDVDKASVDQNNASREADTFELTAQDETTTTFDDATDYDQTDDSSPSMEESVSNESQGELSFIANQQAQEEIDETSIIEKDSTDNSAALARSAELDKELELKISDLENSLSSLDAVESEFKIASDNMSAFQLQVTEQYDQQQVKINDLKSQNEEQHDHQLVKISDLKSQNEEQIEQQLMKLEELKTHNVEQKEKQDVLVEEFKTRINEQMAQQREELNRVRGLLESTAALTRNIAGEHKSLRNVAEQETALRLKSEASAKNALSIARKAVERLSKAKG